MIKKGVVFITLISILCCGKPKIVYNDYSFVKKIDKKFFTKGPTIVPEENLELYLIENENGKLVKKTKEDEDLKKDIQLYLTTTKGIYIYCFIRI